MTARPERVNDALKYKPTLSQEKRVISDAYSFFKRCLDLAISVAALPVALPLMVFIAILIRLDSRGPIFFTQTRVGRGHKQFEIIKFRTMVQGEIDPLQRDYMQRYIRGEVSDKAEIFKPPITHRVTQIGQFLRKTSLDELPQIFNVIKGEMSLVGPRPHVPWEVDAYASWHVERLSATPGITGLAQVNGRSELPFDQLVEYDLEYVRQPSLRQDLHILWLTVNAVLKRQGAG